MADFDTLDPPTWFDVLADLVRTYTRAFLAQGVGVVGLMWCLVDRHPRIGLLLTALVLLDQTVFLRNRIARRPSTSGLDRVLDAWCVAVSIGDLLLLGSIGVQEAGLRGADAATVLQPLDCLAYVLATFLHLGSDLTPLNTAGRFVAIASGLGGWIALGAGAAAILAWRRAKSRE